MQEVDGGSGETAQLDLPGNLFDELVALVVTEVADGVREVGHARVLLGRGPVPETSVRSPCGPEAAWYTRGRRAAMSVTASHEFVERAAASSAAVISRSPWRPRSTSSSWTVTGSPGTSVTSTISASIATLPTVGAR